MCNHYAVASRASARVLISMSLLAFSTGFADEADRWPQALIAAREGVLSRPEAERSEAAERAWARLEKDWPIPCDWLAQDAPGLFPAWLGRTAGGPELKELLGRLRAEVGATDAGPDDEAEQLAAYERLGEGRRLRRLESVRRHAPRVVFTKHRTVRPSFFAYTEGQSDAQSERHFTPGSSLRVWEWDDSGRGNVRTLLEDPTGAIRDPEVSWDGRTVVFAWKKSLDDDDYHLYTIDPETKDLRTITSGLGFADYEPAFLPNGDLVFSSSRCVQTVDCWWTEVSNLYTCAADGRFLRRLSFDQVHSIGPKVLEDGRVIYSRWDYNDRGQIFPQALFQMNADGTGQTEYYKNNSWWPTTIVHARGIPGTAKVLAVFCGHHTTQAGKLGILDPARGREDNAGAQLVAPIRETPTVRIDQYGQDGELFQNPYPLNDHEFLAGYAPRGWEARDREGFAANDAQFGIYWMDLDGHRELLVRDAALPCQQPVPLVARVAPPDRPSAVDYNHSEGTYYVQDVYAGPGLSGVPRGTIRKLRVVALEFRPAGVGNNGNGGPGGGALVCTPIAIGNGAWDVKRILGEATVHADGSAFFRVPARTPLYFQAIDDRGFAAQTMRSWSTLQPGEAASCVGCHESKSYTPMAAKGPSTLALRAGAQRLEPFHGSARGFSFPREVQPILDRHCVSCHDDPTRFMPGDLIDDAIVLQSDPDWSRIGAALARRPMRPDAAEGSASSVEPIRAFSLRGNEVIEPGPQRRWSEAYLNLTLAKRHVGEEREYLLLGRVNGRIVNWIGAQSVPSPLPPYAAGSATSGLMGLLVSGHHGVRVTPEEWDTLAAWIDLFVPYCGDYEEAAAWTPEGRAKYARYLEKRQRMESIEQQNCRDWQNERTGGASR